MELIIAGGGALGRVIYDFVYTTYQIKACIDDADIEKESFNNVPVLNFEQVISLDLSQVKFLLAVLKPKDREYFVKRLISKGGKFFKYIDEQSFISPSASTGKGCVILPYSFIMSKACVGNYVHVHFNSTIGHDVIVGDYCSFAPQCIVGGYVKIGEMVTFGMGAKILPKINIGDYATIGAGAVVTKDVPNGATIVGNPGKIVSK